MWRAEWARKAGMDFRGKAATTCPFWGRAAEEDAQRHVCVEDVPLNPRFTTDRSARFFFFFFLLPGLSHFGPCGSTPKGVEFTEIQIWRFSSVRKQREQMLHEKWIWAENKQPFAEFLHFSYFTQITASLDRPQLKLSLLHQLNAFFLLYQPQAWEQSAFKSDIIIWVWLQLCERGSNKRRVVR